MGECLDKALRLVARRPHFLRELEQKLTDRGFSSAEIEEALVELTRQGWIDDLAHARDLATGPLTRKGFGPRRIRHELRRRGLEDELAERVVSEVFSEPEEELERARRAATREASSGSIEPDRLARHLDRKGYSKTVIMRVLSESGGG